MAKHQDDHDRYHWHHWPAGWRSWPEPRAAPAAVSRALGEAGAMVYCTGLSVRGNPEIQGDRIEGHEAASTDGEKGLAMKN